MSTRPSRSGIDELRLLVSNFNYCNETLNTSYTVEELLQLHRAQQASGWDFFVDQWTRQQRTDCIKRGVVPMWRDDEQPVTYVDYPFANDDESDE